MVTNDYAARAQRLAEYVLAISRVRTDIANGGDMMRINTTLQCDELKLYKSGRTWICDILANVDDGYADHRYREHGSGASVAEALDDALDDLAIAVRFDLDDLQRMAEGDTEND